MTSENFSNIVNWNNLLEKSSNFKSQKPFNFAFIENFFEKNFYDKLYETYPEIDERWGKWSDMEKAQNFRTWSDNPPNEINKIGDDPSLSETKKIC